VNAHQLADSIRNRLLPVFSIEIFRSSGDRNMENATRAKNATIMNGKRTERVFMCYLLQVWY